MNFDFLKKIGGSGSKWGQMDNGQRLMAIGSVLQGDQDGLSQVLAGLNGATSSAPILDAAGNDVSAAFGGILPNEPVTAGRRRGFGIWRR